VLTKLDKNVCMEKLFSVEDKTALYCGKACSYTTCVCLYRYFQTKAFARLIIAFVVIMTSTVKFCPSIEDTSFPPYKHVSKYSV